MTLSYSDFGMSEFFGEMEVNEEVVESVSDLRANLRQYTQAKAVREQVTATMVDTKDRIMALFADLPDDIKVVQNLEPKEVAGVTFSREKKTITIDGFVLVFNEKINTKSPRDKFIKELEAEALQAPTPEAEDAYRNAISIFESHLDPTKGSEFKIEPVKPT